MAEGTETGVKITAKRQPLSTTSTVNSVLRRLDEGSKTTENGLGGLGLEDNKFPEHFRDNLRMKRELRRKDWEIQELKETIENLGNTLNKERKRFEMERREWSTFKDDLLLVVRAADDYKTDAMITVEKYKQENSQLQDKIRSLEADIRKYRI